MNAVTGMKAATPELPGKKGEAEETRSFLTHCLEGFGREIAMMEQASFGSETA
jgi:hypothetical protein